MANVKNIRKTPKQNIPYKSSQIFSEEIELPDLDDKGKVLPSVANFKAILDAHNLKGGINVFTRESGIFRENRTFLEDADIIELLAKYEFPRDVRNSFVDKFSNEGERINIFKENIENADINTSRSYIKEVRDCLIDSEDFMSHLPQDTHRDDLTLKMFRTFLMSVFYQATVTDKGEYIMRNVLILQGKQGIGKSTFFRRLLPQGLFVQADNFPETKDDLDIVTKAVVTEIGEFDSMSGRELSNAKNFISRSEDIYRKPYAVEAIRYPRMTTFIGTTNKSAMLRDSENTRFWVWEVKDINKSRLNQIIASEADKWKFWKEVSAWYSNDREGLFRDIEWMNIIFKEQNEKFRLENDAEERLSETLDLERMEKGNFDGYLPNRMLLCIAYRDTTYKAHKNDEHTVVKVMGKIGANQRNLRVRPKKDTEAQKRQKLVYPVSLTEEAKEWMNKITDIDIYVTDK